MSFDDVSPAGVRLARASSIPYFKLRSRNAESYTDHEKFLKISFAAEACGQDGIDSHRPCRFLRPCAPRGARRPSELLYKNTVNPQKIKIPVRFSLCWTKTENGEVKREAAARPKDATAKAKPLAMSHAEPEKTPAKIARRS